ncbi:glycerate kinase [Schaalia sp. lx-100]|uniref:glycerate kinase n=1 Tax=Schaalia sp. lx-100 TaxID=2899081 RepID=UPI001E3F7F6F|nr:glycerate kinase [Schaalia sp. lx-100]MCD4558066.1 glycerate kinase [Schaalia sp. lx-100]
MKVIVAGHWEYHDKPITTDALAAVGRALRARHLDVQVELLPFGSGPHVSLLCADHLPENWVLIRHNHDTCESTYEAGKSVREALLRGENVLIESEQQWVPHSLSALNHADKRLRPDGGASFLSGLTGITLPSDHIDEELFLTALEHARHLIRSRHVIMAASTQRPLLGLSSVCAVGPEGEPITDMDPSFLRDLGRVYRHSFQTRSEDLLRTSRSTTSIRESDSQIMRSPAELPGSGAGGGIGAVVAATGGTLRGTGEALIRVLGIDTHVNGADLVVMMTPQLHSPILSHSPLPAFTAECARAALPVVAIAEESSLAPYERAQWDIHGVILTRPRTSFAWDSDSSPLLPEYQSTTKLPDSGDFDEDNASFHLKSQALASLYDAGLRLAHTWLSR